MCVIKVDKRNGTQSTEKQKKEKKDIWRKKEGEKFYLSRFKVDDNIFSKFVKHSDTYLRKCCEKNNLKETKFFALMHIIIISLRWSQKG